MTNTTRQTERRTPDCSRRRRAIAARRRHAADAVIAAYVRDISARRRAPLAASAA